MKKRYLIVILLFGVSFLLISLGNNNDRRKKDVPLRTHLQHIGGWNLMNSNEYDTKLLDALEVDDYVDLNYKNAEYTVNLYIGYYLENSKIGSAHDPMVCFPGQGWQISDIVNGHYSSGKNRDIDVDYSAMIVSKGDQKSLVIYWFQSGEHNSSNTFMQKMLSYYDSLLNKSPENAFVRLSVTMDKIDLEKSYEILYNFLDSFYPVFLQYIRSDN